MSEKESKGKIGFVFKLRNYFTTGLLILAPTVVSIWVFMQVFRVFDGILGRFYTKYVFARLKMPTPPGLGAITLTIIVILIGWIGRQYAGRKFLDLWEKAVNYVPLVNRIYIAVRQLSDSFAKGGGIIFQKPVIVQYPRKGMYSIGFITRRCDGPFCRIIGHDVSSVFIPTTPNPTSGVLVFIRQEELIRLEMSVEDAMKLIISAGTVTPDIKLPIVRLD
ncbi:MAG: DUF502 domain-containing protein [Candidatus Latescibacteria bacterium]|nr:DUF502 domain-containing protein [Candidatus Latescibacterota bacterium]